MCDDFQDSRTGEEEAELQAKLRDAQELIEEQAAEIARLTAKLAEFEEQPLAFVIHLADGQGGEP